MWTPKFNTTFWVGMDLNCSHNSNSNSIAVSEISEGNCTGGICIQNKHVKLGRGLNMVIYCSCVKNFLLFLRGVLSDFLVGFHFRQSCCCLH